MYNNKILNKISNVPIWDKDYLNKIENIIFEFLDNTNLTNKKETINYIMNTTKGHLDPKIVDNCIYKYK